MFGLHERPLTYHCIKGKYEYRVTNLEEKVDNLEIKTKQEVASQVTNMKDDIIDSLKSDIYSVVDERNKELKGRKIMRVKSHHL